MKVFLRTDPYKCILCGDRLRFTCVQAGITTVTFTYFIPSLPSWANNRAIRIANTDLDNLVMGIDSERYQMFFCANKHGGVHMVSEPEQLDFLY